MQADNAKVNAATVVRQAREELAAVIISLTDVLAQISKSDNAADAATKDKPPNGAETEAARKEREAQESKTSLTPVLQRLSALRAAVQVAVAARQQMVAQAERDEQAVSAEERSALEERHNMLVMEVHMKDEKIKILIDQLRELHRDIVILLASYFKHLSAQRRT